MSLCPGVTLKLCYFIHLSICPVVQFIQSIQSIESIESIQSIQSTKSPLLSSLEPLVSKGGSQLLNILFLEIHPSKRLHLKT